MITDAQLAEVRSRGFTVVPRFLSAQELADARAALFTLFPTPDAYFADPAAHPRYGKSQFSGQLYFPFDRPALDRLVTHPDLIDGAERLLGSTELDLYKVELWPKYAGAIDYEQPHHRDYGNHTLVVPDGDDWHMTTIIALSDIGPGDGPTAIVPLEHTRDEPMVPMIKAPGRLTEHEQRLTADAGSLIVYRTDVVHRGTNLTGTRASRFILMVDFKRRGRTWTGKQAWPDHALKPGWPRALAAMSVRERDLFGFPRPGDPYWTARTIDLVGQRYPAMDMTPYSTAMA